MKFTQLLVFCALALMTAACSSRSKATQTLEASSLPPTTMVAIATPKLATPTPLLPVTQSPEAAQTTLSATATTVASVTSPTPAALPPLEVKTVAPPTKAPEAQTDETIPGCTNMAVFNADVTVPDGTSFRQGDTFVKTWRIRNVGTCDWGVGYALVFASGDVMSAPLSNSLPEIPHDTSGDISVNLTAPARGGGYQSNWEFQSPDGQRFGVGSPASGLLWAQIAVSFIEPTQSPSSDSGLGTASQPASSGACDAQHDPSVDVQVLALINQARTNQGLEPLESQGQLAAAALAHSTDMACNNIVSHVGSDGSLWYNRVSAQGYANYNSSRENIYVGNPAFGGTADGAFTWWWNSQVHQDNMLNPDVSQIGVAYVYNLNSEYGGYYTTVFARP